MSCSQEDASEKPSQELSQPNLPSQPPGHPPAKPDDFQPASQFLFTDITGQAGLDFVHYNDSSARRYLPETMGAGAAFFDFDGDNLPDIYLVNGTALRGGSRSSPTGALYKNLGNGRFKNVTRGSGLEDSFYGMGAAVGDIDNDGRIDLFVTAVGGDRLYRNLGGGRFEDVTARMGLVDKGFGSSAAFLDYDRDGYLDLFAGRYVEWSLESDVQCSPNGVHQTYCTPEVYKGASNRLYRNLGGKRFEDVTRASGIRQPQGKTLGVAVFDHNRDGWPDLAIANDTVRNFLFVNNGDGTFSESAIESGIAYSESGATRGGMGIDAGDIDADGLTDVVIGNFSQEMSALYRGLERGFYVDDAAQLGLGLPTLMTLAFGTLVDDFDGDGSLDVLIINGHIEPEIARTQQSQSYAQLPQFFRNLGKGRLELLQDKPSSPLQRPLVGRGLASADIDGDGDLDFLITQNGRAPVLLRNDHPRRSWIRVRPVGRRSNRSGYGVWVKVIAGAETWSRSLVSGRSYLSACEPVLTIGLGGVQRVDRLEIQWPSGAVQTIHSPSLNRLITVEEPADR
ncbi:MAG: CRTAC1 family protein [Acidobacteriota bacterium]